ncbi:MAG: GNAT family N-acetyltransferase [Waterburya sp.]
MKIFLQTPRLILRQLNEDDLDNLVILDSDPEVMRFINGGIAVSRKAIAENFLPYVMSYDNQDELGFWAIIEKSSQEFIGWIFLRPEADFKLLQQLNLADSEAIELGYRIRKLSWGKGYTTEASQALVNRCFTESNINKINAWALAENKASVRVMEKAGLKLQQQYIVTPEMLTDPNLQENLLVQNLLNRPFVKYQIRLLKNY